MKRLLAIFAIATLILLAGSVFLFSILPEAVSFVQDTAAQVRDHGVDIQYSDEWPVSEAEFNAVILQAQKKRSFSEVFADVVVAGPNDIRVTIRSRGRKRLSSRVLHFEKVDGEWKFSEESRRRSIGWMFSEAT
jgi:hypothetical protein